MCSRPSLNPMSCTSAQTSIRYTPDQLSGPYMIKQWSKSETLAPPTPRSTNSYFSMSPPSTAAAAAPHLAMSNLDSPNDAHCQLTPPSSAHTSNSTPGVEAPASSRAAHPPSPAVSRTNHAAGEEGLREDCCEGRETLREDGPAERIAFMAGRDDFRSARLRCAMACQQYNNMAEDGSAEDRMAKWLNIVDPEGNIPRTGAVPLSELFKQDAKSKNPPPTPAAGAAGVGRPRPTFPYVKTPVYVDYGLRVRIAPTAFVNRNCCIFDTPVADVTIGERCAVGPGVTIVAVGHSVRHGERCEFLTGRPGSWGAKVVVGDGVWIGAGATILPGVTIGEDSTIGAGSVVTRDIPPRCVAFGNPAKVRYFISDDDPPAEQLRAAMTLDEALKMGREEKEEKVQSILL